MGWDRTGYFSWKGQTSTPTAWPLQADQKLKLVIKYCRNESHLSATTALVLLGYGAARELCLCPQKWLCTLDLGDLNWDQALHQRHCTTPVPGKPLPYGFLYQEIWEKPGCLEKKSTGRTTDLRPNCNSRAITKEFQPITDFSPTVHKHLSLNGFVKPNLLVQFIHLSLFFPQRSNSIKNKMYFLLHFHNMPLKTNCGYCILRKVL